MGYRFRKSMKLGPLRFTLSKSGLSASVGVKGLRVTKMANGRTRTTASIPGTGISYVKESSGKKKDAAPQPIPVAIEDRTPETPICETLLDAAELLAEEKTVNVALVQRRCRLGYTKAARVLDAFTRCGLLGPYQPSGSREVLFDGEDLRDEELRNVLDSVFVDELPVSYSNTP